MMLIKKGISKYNLLSVQIKASLWFLVSSVLQKGVSIMTTPIFTRLLSTSEYGIFNVFTSWQGIVTAIVILTFPWGCSSKGLLNLITKEKYLHLQCWGL